MHICIYVDVCVYIYNCMRVLYVYMYIYIYPYIPTYVWMCVCLLCTYERRLKPFLDQVGIIPACPTPLHRPCATTAGACSLSMAKIELIKIAQVCANTFCWDLVQFWSRDAGVQQVLVFHKNMSLREACEKLARMWSRHFFKIEFHQRLKWSTSSFERASDVHMIE